MRYGRSRCRNGSSTRQLLLLAFFFLSSCAKRDVAVDVEAEVNFLIPPIAGIIRDEQLVNHATRIGDSNLKYVSACFDVNAEAERADVEFTIIFFGDGLKIFKVEADAAAYKIAHTCPDGENVVGVVCGRREVAVQVGGHHLK